MYKFTTVVCAGTFDHLHKGHQAFLLAACALGKNVYIGITKDNFIQEKQYKDTIESYRARSNSVQQFLRKNALFSRAHILGISSSFIPPSIEKRSPDAIVVTRETRRGAEAINEDRKKRRLQALFIEEVPYVLAQDHLPITSSRIRAGEINREGRISIDPEWRNKTLVLPDIVRKRLKRPFGTLVTTQNAFKKALLSFDSSKLITVGDVVTKSANELGISQQISSVDFLVERMPTYGGLEDLGFDKNALAYDVTNPPGVLAPELFSTVTKIFQEGKSLKRYILRIRGEEDLSLLVFILCAPLGFTAVYGQPGEGAVFVAITEKTKDKAYAIVKSFK